MRLAGKAFSVLALAMVSACGGASDSGQSAAGSETAAAGVPEVAAVAPASGQPPAAYAQCRSCHSVVAGQHGIGPSLHGVFGAKAAAQPGFKYSPALTGAGLTWDEATLDKWLQGPTAMVPGTRMILAPMPDPARRKAVIDYLATLK